MKPKVKWDDKKIMALAENQLRRWLTTSAIRVENSIVRSLRGPSPSEPGTPPGTVTGSLWRSLTHEIDVNKREARIGPSKNSPAHKYAAEQEFGGTITAKDKKMAIPLNKRARLDALAAYSLRSIYGLRAVPINDNVFLANESGELMYVLKDSVRLPPRPYLRPGLDRERAAIAQDLERIKVVP
jgi:hypothetical protein